jgi:lipopolysaccharide/colanic/teichoic acid biosynthesis glycosyltransferase
MLTNTLPNTTPFRRPHKRPWRTRFAKRALDIFASALGLLLLWPLFIIIAILIKRDSPGPVFFCGLRMGKGGEPFHILKFRTMRESPESYDGPKVTASGDDRITPLGKWLRDTKLNELPQLWNVLVGEMSLVGPRPEDPDFVSRWPSDARLEILSVRPGITSPASISYSNEEKLLSSDNWMGDYLEKIAPDKIRLDCLYVRHHNLMTDLDAIFWTLIVLVPRAARRPASEGQLFGGPFTRLARPYFNWFVFDFITALVSVMMVGLVWRIFAPLHIGWDWAPVVAVMLAFEFGLLNLMLGLGRVEWSRVAAEDAFMLFASCALVAAVNIVADIYIPFFTIPNGYILAASVLTLVGFIVTRYRLRLLTGLATRWVNLRRAGLGAGERVLVIGAGSSGEIATWLLRRLDMKRLFCVIGYVDDDPSKQGMRFDGLPVIGTTADLPALVEREDIGLLVYAIGRIPSGDRERILAVCRQTPARLVILADVLQMFQSHFTPVGKGAA